MRECNIDPAVIKLHCRRIHCIALFIFKLLNRENSNNLNKGTSTTSTMDGFSSIEKFKSMAKSKNTTAATIKWMNCYKSWARSHRYPENIEEIEPVV